MDHQCRCRHGKSYGYFITQNNRSYFGNWDLQHDEELDYGTYDYQVLLNDTQVATHQHIFVRPEPTFTTSWTKSGLSITADLSGIVGGHPEFYAYLCRDGGTTLDTHQFQIGQTTTSLAFTEADYGSYNYQLKLGTVVKSSHTETYVRPTPTYTTSFSTNELTLTASITSITNAHNSFAITLERDDGTVLQTHTLADGETSFTFTQTETSYATFNYVVKINGTQTDTYSATYTPPPTPTFDIALTNDDLAITATLTNIVNPDPYYTLMIHDANDTHLDGHTFATGDTTVVLTWTETSYGEKTYTKLLNGASIGTDTITLTDPNTGPPSNGYYPGYAIIYDASSILPSGYPGTSGTKYYYGIGASGSIFSGGYYFYWDSSNNTWNDAAAGDGQADPVSFSYSATPIVNGTSQAFSLNAGSGSWANEGYTLFVDDTPTTASSGVVVNGVRNWEWDLKNSSNNFWSGADHYFYFIPGSSATSGLWYLGGSLASRSGSVITDINGGGSFDETNAFVDGLVPYGDIP
ncbi:unnamed protein product [Bathycoccus prasinos]